jgi:diguanylate cyclase (GGDEF)-like protein
MSHEIKTVELFQSRAGYTLQRARLKQLNRQLAEANAGLNALATTDPLTGLPNRRLFDERLRVEWQRASRQGKSLGLVAIDVDHFKHYNDRFGHPAGDECLKQVAGAIDAARRSVDVAARIGGEEFAILLPDVDAAGIASVAERVRRAVEHLGLDHPQAESKVVTISIGTAVGTPIGSAKASDLMNAADRALYVAKADGRNRVAESG